LKILQVINSLATGGAEKLLLETLPLYCEKGIDMDVLVLNGTDYPFMKQLKALNCCDVYSLGLKSVYNPLHIFKIIPYLKKYDIVHVHLFPAQYWVVFAKIVSFSKVKLVFAEHSTSNRRKQNRFFQFFDKYIYSYYHTVICITDQVKQILERHVGSKSNSFIVIENGVNIEVIKNSNTYSKSEINNKINQNDKIIIQVAGFRKPKDQPTLIKALQYLPANFKLLLVGDGILRKDCEDLVHKLQLNDRVFFLGFRSDVPQLLKTADISILSSHWEGFGLVAVEGMASGKPLVAANIPGLSEVVSGAAILFEQGNAKKLAKELAKLASNPDYYQSVAKACQDRANLYDIKIMVAKHIKLYESIS
jgi:glycosyltransferase involved in cell wall biosynthesis